MKVLVTVNDAYGHVLPLVPAVREMSRRGHDVIVACPGATADVLAVKGVRVSRYPRPEGPSPIPPPPRDEIAGRLAWAVQTSWPHAARSWAPALLADASVFGPDVVVCEPVENAGRVVAAALDVPLVEHGWGFGLPGGWSRLAADGLADLYDALHTDFQEPALRVDVGPASVQAGDVEPEVDRFRFTPWAPPAEPLPAPGTRPRILLTLGTFAHPGAEERLRTVAGAASTADAELVVVLGNDDRGSSQGYPPGTLVRSWVDLPAEITRCALVIHHGGAGSSWATLAAGVPAVCLPQAGDQFRNADLLATAAAGVVVLPEVTDHAALAETIVGALANPALRAGAQQVQRDNNALPEVAAMVDLIESIAA